MTIDAGQSVGMADIYSIAEAIEVDGDAADVSICNGIDLFAFLIVRLDVNASMEMPWTGFAKVASKHYVVIYWRTIFYNIFAGRLNITAATCQQ